jgi:class 3 adenylate cyclase
VGHEPDESPTGTCCDTRCRLMEQDEAGTLARIKGLRSEVIEPRVTKHGGRVFKTAGDGFLVEFPSPVGLLDENLRRLRHGETALINEIV